MSRPQYGNDMDRVTTGDIIRRARERAEAGLPREDYATFLRRQQMNNATAGSPPTSQKTYAENPLPRRLQAPPGLHDQDGQIALPISRPAPVPQWPLAAPLAAPSTSLNTEPYRPPAGTSPPRRPPRPSPSHVPSMLDASKVQDQVPSFQYQQRYDNRDSDYTASSIPPTPSTLSRPSTLSSVASIPDFPLPMQAPLPPAMLPPRRSSMTLGPPPSARRGASSFYSHLSYVSPIPEESIQSRSHTSYASSAAIPESWRTPSPDSPTYAEVFYDETTSDSDAPSSPSDSERSTHDEYDGDESRLVRSASLGRRGKAELVTTPPVTLATRDTATPGQPETSTNLSNTVPANDMKFNFGIPSAGGLRGSRRMSEPASVAEADARNSRGFSRLSAIRRPPRLDMDAVRQAEGRGSLTSLPDLIRRATRLAASLDRGRRPASRFDMDDFPPEFYGGNTSKSAKVEAADSDELYDDKHQSGLSGMLAAFPPPAQAASRTGAPVRKSLRQSVLSWPLPPRRGSNGSGSWRGTSQLGQQEAFASGASTPKNEKKGRRCCGLPMWGFVLLLVIALLLVAAAVIIPIEFLVIRKKNPATNTTAAADQQCQKQLTCRNGGTNVVTNGICSCICSNGFNGFDCSTSDSVGCTTTTLSGATNISNVTLGDAIPRLITLASTSFAISLSDSAIISKLNSGNLSCTSQNALVTFNGNDGSTSTSTNALSNALVANAFSNSNLVEQVQVVNNVAIATLTIMAGQSTTITLTVPGVTTPPTTTITLTSTTTTQLVPSVIPTTAPPVVPTIVPTTAPAVTSTPSIIPSPPPPAPTTPAFTVSSQVLDFARVGVLFVLQSDSLTEATTAQSALQTFFTSVSTSTTPAAASNITLSNGNSIDLVNFRIDAGTGLVGSRLTSAKRDTRGAARGAVRRAAVNTWWERPHNLGQG